jgi:hypothetical protein
VDACAAAVPCTGDYIIENSSDMDEAALCESISDDLTITRKTWLTNTDLPCLTSVGGILRIYSNPALTDISGLSSLTSVGGDLNIYSNPVLCQSLVDAFVAACSCGTVGNITYNDDGC